MKRILAALITLVLIFALVSCGNINIMENMTSDSNTFRYILIQEAGEWHLHTIDKWSDSGSSDAVGVVTSCCHNRFWTSYNSAILYKEMPTYLPDNVIICGKD